MQPAHSELYEPPSGSVFHSRADGARRESVAHRADEPFSSAQQCIAGRFLTSRRLGSGGFATVFAARDRETGDTVALKLLPRYGEHAALSRERVEAEVELSRRVVHPNLCRVIDWGHTEDGRPFLVTEALKGETLGQCLRRRGRISVDGALRLVREAARGLSALHRSGIVHRDVKPDNLFLCESNEHDVALKVIDFGFAARIDSAPEDPTRVLGTLRYTAPEQAVGEPVDARADVYSLGIVLFRAVTGELPFDACADRDIIRHHVASAVPPPSWLREGIPHGVDTLVGGAVRKCRENRYATMSDLTDDLDRVMAGRRIEGPVLSVDPDEFRARTEIGRRVISALTSAAGPRSRDSSPR